MWHPQSPCTKGALKQITCSVLRQVTLCLNLPLFLSSEISTEVLEASQGQTAPGITLENQSVPEEQQLPPGRAGCSPGQLSGMQGPAQLLPGSQGLATRQLQPLTGSSLGWLEPGTSSFCSHSQPFPHIEKREREKTRSNLVRSLFWKRKSNPCSTWAEVLQQNSSGMTSLTAGWPSAQLIRCSGLQQTALQKTYLSGTNSTKSS